MTHKTAQSIRDAAEQLSTGALPLETIATNLLAYAESVDRVEHELVRLRSASASVAVAITQLHENSLLMLNVVETRQPRAADGQNTKPSGAPSASAPGSA